MRDSATAPRYALQVALPSAVHGVDLVPAFGSYGSTDAAWAKGVPLAVNREFDFASALAMPDIGIGLAASQRAAANRELAERLPQLPNDVLQAAFLEVLSAVPGTCGSRTDTTVYLYALLFGEMHARLQVALELRSTRDAAPMRLIDVSEPRPIAGEDSWTARDGATLTQSLRAAAQRLARNCSTAEVLLRSQRDATSARDTHQCEVGDQQHAVGSLLGQTSGKSVLLRRDAPPALLLCDPEHRAAGDASSASPAAPDTPGTTSGIR